MMKVLGLLLTVGLQALGHPWGQSIPPSPCPDIFQYEVDSAGMSYALISVRYAEPDFNIILEVVLAMDAILPSKNAGDLCLIEDETEIWRRLMVRDKQPVLYKLHFPLTRPLPLVERITLNQNVICQGKPPSNMWTKYSVNHKLFPIPKSLQNQYPKNPGSPTTGICSIATVQRTDTHTAFIPPVTTALPTNIIGHSSGHECGVSFTTRVKRVIKGMVTERGQWPWLVAMYKKSASAGLKFQCGGSLLSKTVVLTAAQCIRIKGRHEVKVEAIVLIMGKYNLEEWTEENSQVRDVKEIHLHPDYDGDALEADLAILILNEQVEYTKYVQPICLWPFTSDLDQIVGQSGTVVGWGQYESGDLSSQPRMTTMPIVSQDECHSSNADFVPLTSNRTFCAGSRDGSGPCSGDSGGGFMMNYPDGDQPRWYLRGVIHLSLFDKPSQQCDLRNYLIYTDVAKFMDWIRQFVPY